MKFSLIPLILVTITLPVCLSCQEEKIIPYEEAIKNAKMDTMFSVGVSDKGSPDTMYFVHQSPKSIEGAQLPTFEAYLMNGQTVNDDYFKNKINVINFWFIGCEPCAKEMPGFNAMAKKYRDDPVNFLAISRNKPEDIKEFMIDHPFDVDHMPLGQLITEEVFHMTWGYPMTIVTDSHGKILLAYKFGSGGPKNHDLAQQIQDDLIPVIDGALKKM